MEIQTHYLAAANVTMQKAMAEGNHWMVFDGRPYMTNPNYLKFFSSAEEARKEAGIDFSMPTHQRAVLLQPIAESVQQTSNLHTAGQVNFGHVVSVDINKILQDYQNERPRATVELTKADNPYYKNIDALSKQLLSLGFSDTLLPKLKESFEKGEKEFMLSQTDPAGKKTTAATLHFRETVNGDRLVLDHFNAFLQKTLNGDPIKQTFFHSEHGSNINYKEAVNLLEGRAILKDNKWLQLDFKNINERGDFEIKTITGYNIDALLNARPIKELHDEGKKLEIMAALQRGERVQVTFEEKNIAMKAHIEAAPRFHSLHYYGDNEKRISYEQIKNTLEPTKEKSLQHQNTQRETRSRKLSV